MANKTTVPCPPLDEFQVGWICTLPIEFATAIEMLDEEFNSVPKPDRADWNTYCLGRIGVHYVAIACLPDGQNGIHSAATIVRHMLYTFKSLRTDLMVGIGSGIPSQKHDIRLGDVVVSCPRKTCGGVAQYDVGKIGGNGKVHQAGPLDAPPTLLLSAVTTVRAHALTDYPRYLEYMDEVTTRNAKTRKIFRRPSPESDRLFQIGYGHLNGAATCDGCAVQWEVTREEREGDLTQVRYGIVATGNTVINDGMGREQIPHETRALCFKKNAAGLMQISPCIIIRGISDYADSHKGEQ